MNYRRKEVRTGPEPMPTEQSANQSASAPAAQMERSSPPQKEPPIALEWQRFIEEIDTIDKIVETACNRFSAVCAPSSPVDKKSLAEKEPMRRSDMADAIAFETNRIRQISSKLAYFIERCQL
jgi:hypothetical protein